MMALKDCTIGGTTSAVETSAEGVDLEEVLGGCAGAAGVVEDGAAYGGKGPEQWRQV